MTLVPKFNPFSATLQWIEDDALTVGGLAPQTLTATSPISLSGVCSVLAAAGITVSHEATAGNIHLPTGGTSNKLLKNSGVSGTGAWGTVTESSGALAAVTTINMTGALSSSAISNQLVLGSVNTTTITTSLLIGSAVITLPAATATLATLGLKETFSGQKTFSAQVTIGEGVSVFSGTVTGTKWGGATNHKQAWWNATPIVQPANTVKINDVLTTCGFRATGGVSDFSTTLTPPAGTTAIAPINFLSGTNKTTAAAGDMEYNGTNLFFTRTGTTREYVYVGDTTTAPATNIGVGIVNYYGSSATNFLGDPVAWGTFTRGATVYKIPLYT